MAIRKFGTGEVLAAQQAPEPSEWSEQDEEDLQSESED